MGLCSYDLQGSKTKAKDAEATKLTQEKLEMLLTDEAALKAMKIKKAKKEARKKEAKEKKDALKTETEKEKLVKFKTFKGRRLLSRGDGVLRFI